MTLAAWFAFIVVLFLDPDFGTDPRFEGSGLTALAHIGGPLVLAALVTFNRDRGNRDAAINWAQRLVALDPNDPNAAALLRSVRGG